jgi:putative ABC transport system substrate-binding protein
MIDRIRIGRPFLYGIIATLALVSSATQKAAQAETTSDWFRYDSSIEKAWTVSGTPAHPMQFDIRRKTTDGTSSQRVLVLYPRASSAYDIAITKILQIFALKEANVALSVLNFNMQDSLGAEAIRFAENNGFSLIVAMGSESTAWLLDHYRGGKIPVVSVCSKDPVQLGQIAAYDVGTNNNFAFTSLNVPVDVQMAYVKELRPDLKNIAVLVDRKNVSAMQTQAEPVAAYARARGIQFIWGGVDNPAKAREQLIPIVQSAVNTMRKNDPDLSKSIFLLTGSTSVFLEIRVINEYADRVPVISVVPEIVKAGPDTAALAIGVSFESNAHLAAIYALDILSGKSQAGDLKVGVVSPPDIAISFMKAREIGLRVPFQFYETASYIYDYDGNAVRTVTNKIALENQN